MNRTHVLPLMLAALILAALFFSACAIDDAGHSIADLTDEQLYEVLDEPLPNCPMKSQSNCYSANGSPASWECTDLDRCWMRRRSRESDKAAARRELTRRHGEFR
jgi:hypothetical protein